MKQFLPFILFTFLISLPIFSQNKLGQIAYGQWDVEEEKWNYYSFENWTYDEEGREATYEYRDSRYSDYLPTNNTKSISKYDGSGKLIEQNNLYYGPELWQNSILQLSYNSENLMTEQLETRTSSNHENIFVSKYIFENDPFENRRSTKFYWKENEQPFALQNQRDTIFNDQNCIVELTNLSYNVVGDIQSGRVWKMEYTNDCQILKRDFYRWNVNLEMMEHREQHIYEYHDEGKLQIITYLEYDNNINQWRTEHVLETEFDDDGNKVRYFVESFRNNYIDSTLQFYTYTSRNELETFEEFETVNTLNGRVFLRARKDSFSYHYNLQDKIVLKENFIQHRENDVIKNKTIYKYYCNGQLKSESYEGSRPYSRKDFRYVGGVDCPLEDEEDGILLFPNPTSGKVTIHANLLANSEATIQVFTILGQEVFSQKVNQTNYQYQMDLSSLESGHYILFISNKEDSVSDKLVIF